MIRDSSGIRDARPLILRSACTVRASEGAERRADVAGSICGSLIMTGIYPLLPRPNAPESWLGEQVNGVFG
jgi:hypothetical protein